MLLVKFILIHYALILISKKYNVQQKIKALGKKLVGSKIGDFVGKFLYSVSECVFCLTHHIGIIALPYVFLQASFSWEFLLYPLLSTGALFLITGKE